MYNNCTFQFTAKPIWYSSIFSSIKRKLDIWLFVDFLFLPVFTIFCMMWSIIKLFCQSKQNNFMITSCKNTEINKQSYVKFWPNWIKFEAVHIHKAVLMNVSHFKIPKLLQMNPTLGSTNSAHGVEWTTQNSRSQKSWKFFGAKSNLNKI